MINTKEKNNDVFAANDPSSSSAPLELCWILTFYTIILNCKHTRIIKYVTLDSALFDFRFPSLGRHYFASYRAPILENSFWNRSLKPLHRARISGYWYPLSSKPWGMVRTGRPITRAVLLALKQSQKYPGCLVSMQKAYADRLGLASTYVISHFSASMSVWFFFQEKPIRVS